ncbi:MAG TPA: phage holin family protein [Conexibacter sp.]|jgi:putative membrane protein|nr:phage holin family protein [Conexibacter sp.]
MRQHGRVRTQRFLVTWAFNVAALWVAAKLLSGVHVSGDHAWVTFVLAGLVFSLVNMVVKPIVAVLAIPLIILTLGIAYFLVNVLMVFLTSWVVGDFHVDGFWSGVGAAVIVWAVNALLAAAERRLAGD